MLAYNILTTKKKRKGGVKVNFLPVIIGVLLFSLFSDKGGGKQSGGSGNAIDMENIQNTVGAINSFNKLGGKDTDKMSVVMELMSRRGGAGWQVFRQSADERSRRKNT